MSGWLLVATHYPPALAVATRGGGTAAADDAIACTETRLPLPPLQHAAGSGGGNGGGGGRGGGGGGGVGGVAAEEEACGAGGAGDAFTHTRDCAWRSDGGAPPPAPSAATGLPSTP